MEKTIVVIGNGPSLRGFDLTTLSHVDTLGMNAAYRFWDRINWYPTHYCCLDSELVETHAEAILRLVQTGLVKTAFLDGRFLEIFPETKQNERFVFLDQFIPYWYQNRGAELGLSFTESSVFKSSQPDKLTTGSYAARYAIHLGYQRIALIGIDLQYVEQIPEAENTSGIQLVMTQTPSYNPNYFFDDYQQAGDKFQIPNPKAHNFDLHPASFEVLRSDAFLKNLDVEIVNCNTQSVLHSKGVFPYMPLWKLLKQPGLGALVIPTQARECNRILNNLRLWQKPAYAPFLHLSGRKPPKLIFTFTGAENERLKQEIRYEFEKSAVLQRFFSGVEFYFFLLPQGEDVYISDRSLPVGKKGYKSGPNQQFFHSVFALQGICEYAFFMETDCVPLRPDWLGMLSDLVQGAEEFWILGSPYKGQATLSRNYARHINGNAIYALGNPHFVEFAKKWQHILDETTEKIDSGMAYDCVLESIFSREFGPDPSLPKTTFNIQSAGWKLFQEVAPYIRYTNYVLNFGGQVDLDKADRDLLLYMRKDYREAYVVHNRTLCDNICAEMLAEEFENPQLEEFIQVIDALTREPGLGFDWEGLFFRGKVHPTPTGFVVGHGADENFVALQYAKPVCSGDSLQVALDLSVDNTCTLSIALYQDGESPFEGIRQTFHCQGGTEQFEIKMQFAYAHTGIRIEIGSNEPSEVEFVLNSVTIQPLLVSVAG